MSLRPWFKQYPSDFIAGVTGMTGEQIGVYAVLLNLMYARKKRLPHTKPKDVQGLARASGVTTRGFNQIVEQLKALPNKIHEIGGELTNPRFERWLAGEGGRAQEVVEDDHKGTNVGQFGPIFEPENQRKNRDNLDEKQPQNEATLNNPKGLTPELPLPVRARARSICQIPDSKIVQQGSAAAPETDATAEHMTPAGFGKWVQACAKTIPRGWSPPKAEKRWLKLELIPWEDLASAWHSYIADNREKSKNSKFKQRTHHPENWLKDRVFEPYLAGLTAAREQERTAAAAIAQRDQRRNDTIAAWGKHGHTVLQKIGLDSFARYLTDTAITAKPDGTFEIDFFANDRARSDANQLLWVKLEQALGAKVFFTSDRTRTSDAAFAKRQAKPPP